MSFSKKIIYALSIVFLFFIVCEASSFVYFWMKYLVVQEKKKYDLGVYVSDVFLGWDVYQKKIIKQKYLFTQKPKNTYRIIVLGGSAAYGWGASTVETQWPNQLQKLLGKNVEVLNLAVPSFTSIQEVASFLTDGRWLSADLVIAYNGYNDITQMLRFHSYNLTCLDKYEDYSKSGIQWQPIINKSFFLIFFQRKLLQNLRHLGIYKNFVPKESENSHISYSPDHQKTGIEVFQKNMEQLARLTLFYKMKFLLILQPDILTGKKILSLDEQNMDFYYQGELKELFVNSRQKLHAVNQKSLTQYSHLTYLDFKDVFQNVSQAVWVDYIHNNDVGQKMIAEKIKEIIRPWL